MRIGIIGLPQAGKKTLFGLLTQYTFSEKDSISNKAVKSFASIKDSRFEYLLTIYQPEKQGRARIDIELLPRIEQDAIRKGDIFKDIAELDTICHVVRAFEDESVYHINGSVDYKRDIDNINSELILNDLLFIEKRLERIDNNLKKGKDAATLKEKELLLRIREHVEKGLPLRVLNLNPSEAKIIASYPFITRKKMIIVLNVSEGDLHNSARVEQLRGEYQSRDIDIIQVCAKIESEIAKLQTAQEQEEFLAALEIKEPAIDVLARRCIKALNLISFFTVGSDEVRQWLIKVGSSASEAAGAIHTDLQRGFIRAEIMKFDDFAAIGTEEKLKQAGKFYLKGRDYIIEDGDIVSIRFSV